MLETFMSTNTQGAAVKVEIALNIKTISYLAVAMFLALLLALVIYNYL
jgi:hypothetical protein